MSRNPLIPALVAFLFSSLFSFAASAIEGEWERLDDGARMRLNHDHGGRLHGTLTNALPLARSHDHPSPRDHKLRGLRSWLRRFAPRPGRLEQAVYHCAAGQDRIGSARLLSSDRLILRLSNDKQSSKWRRIV